MRRNRDAGADAVAVTPHTDGTNLECVSAARSALVHRRFSGGGVAKHLERATVVRDDKIDVAVVVDVSRNQRASDALPREPGSGLTAHFDEATSVRALKQKPPLCMRGTRTKQGGVIDDVAVDD